MLKMLSNIETNRLFLRKLELEDADSLFIMRNNPISHEFTDTVVDESISNTINYINKMNQGVEDNLWTIFGITLKSNHQLIGTISIWNFNKEYNDAELGFGLDPDYWHQGYMQEAIKAITYFGFNTLKLDKINAYTEKNNLRSKNTLEKLKFKVAGEIFEKAYSNKSYLDKGFHMVIYYIERSEYFG